MIIGTCSLCGGDVVGVDCAYAGTPPPASCRSCGAVEARRRGPVIPMVPRTTRDTESAARRAERHITITGRFSMDDRLSDPSFREKFNEVLRKCFTDGRPAAE